MKTSEIHPAAQQELEEVIAYYDDISEDLGNAFKTCYCLYARLITESPLHYNIRGRAVRRVNLTPQFGDYYLSFMIWKNRVVILAVAHAKRRPYYWRKRIGEAREMF